MRNRRSILVLLLGIALLCFLHVAVWPFDERRTECRRTLVGDADAVRVLKIERRGCKAFVLRHDETEGWRIVEPFSGRADEAAVARLLDVLALAPIVDSVSDDELVRLGRTRADFSLVDPVVRVSLETSGGHVAVVSFGMPTPASDGVYATFEGVGAVFVVPAEVLAAVDRPSAAFRRRTIFSVAPESVSSFAVRQGTGAHLSFVRESGGWKVDGELASKARVEGFLAELLTAEAIDFVWPVGASNETERVSASLLAGYGLEPESAVTVSLKGADGMDRQISFGKAAAPGRVYASTQSGSIVVTVRDALKAAALQKKTVFSDSRLFPLSESAVGFLRVLDGDCAYVLARNGEDAWRLETPVAAPADSAAVGRLLARILALPSSAVSREATGFSVSVSTDSVPVSISRERVLGEDRIDSLRSLEMMRINPQEVKRLVSMPGGKGARALSVVRGHEEGVWSLESADDRLEVRPKAIAGVLKALNPLVAERVERLKVSAADLDTYGLGVPFLTVAVDLDRENTVRRNILIGGETKGGHFATVGSTDAVFVVSEETVDSLSEALAEE